MSDQLFTDLTRDLPEPASTTGPAPDFIWETQPDLDLSGGWPGLALDRSGEPGAGDSGAMDTGAREFGEGDAAWIESLSNEGNKEPSDWASTFKQELVDLEPSGLVAYDDSFLW